jgi:hypothetical protein
MADRLLCDDHKNWIAVDQKVTSPEFPALSMAIQGLGFTHQWLRKMEYEIIMNGLVAANNSQLYQGYQQTSVFWYKQIEFQATFYFATYWVKSLFEVVSIINNGRGVHDPRVYKKSLNDLARLLNIIREPFAKHQIERTNVLSFPMPRLILGNDNSICWNAIDKNGEKHEFSRVYLAERFIRDVMAASEKKRIGAVRTP